MKYRTQFRVVEFDDKWIKVELPGFVTASRMMTLPRSILPPEINSKIAVDYRFHACVDTQDTKYIGEFECDGLDVEQQIARIREYEAKVLERKKNESE